MCTTYERIVFVHAAPKTVGAELTWSLKLREVRVASADRLAKCRSRDGTLSTKSCLRNRIDEKRVCHGKKRCVVQRNRAARYFGAGALEYHRLQVHDSSLPDVEGASALCTFEAGSRQAADNGGDVFHDDNTAEPRRKFGSRTTREHVHKTASCLPLHDSVRREHASFRHERCPPEFPVDHIKQQRPRDTLRRIAG